MAIQLRPVRAPIAIQKEYHKKLKAFIREMDKSLFWWLRASYRQVDKDVIQTAQDGAMGDLVKELRRLEREWVKKSNTFATETAKWFSGKIQGYTAITIQNEMKKRDLVKLGFDLKFKYHSAKERAMFKSIVTQNVNLIKSIASEHLTRVTGVVLRGIESGHDLGRMTEEMEKSFGVTERRAAIIARDQTNKATQNLSRQRLMDYGVTKGKWQHSSAGNTYRESHVEMDGEIYDLDEGCYDPDYGDYIQPAELVNCHCFCVPVIDMGNGEGGESDDN
jgi:SPP1 gp7 family putative phage head morphogenesis protein